MKLLCFGYGDNRQIETRKQKSEIDDKNLFIAFSLYFMQCKCVTSYGRFTPFCEL